MTNKMIDDNTILEKWADYQTYLKDCIKYETPSKQSFPEWVKNPQKPIPPDPIIEKIKLFLDETGGYHWLEVAKVFRKMFADEFSKKAIKAINREINIHENRVDGKLFVSLLQCLKNEIEMEK